MKNLSNYLFIALLLAGAVSTAYADCYRNGTAYPTGTVINGYKCTEEGTWQKV